MDLMEWLAQKPTWAVWCMALGAFLLLAAGVFALLRAAWHSVDPPYEAVRRRPRELKPWHLDPVTERVALAEPRRSLDPGWRDQVLADQPAPPARHRHEHVGEETRSWDPEVLKRTLRQARERDGG